MADIEKGDTFIDHRSPKPDGKTKPKYFLCMNDADDLDDRIVCFVMNTENRMDIHTLACNSKVGKFIIEPSTLTYIVKHTSIMLSKAYSYTYQQILEQSSINQLEKITDDELLRRIKNCIDFDDLLPLEAVLVKEAFKNNK